MATFNRNEVDAWIEQNKDDWFVQMTWPENIRAALGLLRSGDTVDSWCDGKGVHHWQVNGKKSPHGEFAALSAAMFLLDKGLARLSAGAGTYFIT